MTDQNTSQEVVLIQFARAPVSGQVKTRLLPALDENRCVELHCALVQHTFQQLRAVTDADLQLWVSGSHAFFLKLINGTSVTIHLQQGADLGERMADAIRNCLENYHYVVLVGSDCPAIDAGYVQLALQMMRSGVPMVLGPAEDGGYALLAMSHFEPGVFSGVCWGSDRVLQQTRSRLSETGLQWQELPVVADIDRPSDLENLRSYPDLAKYYYECT